MRQLPFGAAPRRTGGGRRRPGLGQGPLPGPQPACLVGLYDRAPYLHDGRAKTLRDVLTKHHVPEKLTAPRPLTAAELDALIDNLDSL